MKFSCDKYLLQAAVTTAKSCAATKSPIPALEGLLIQAGANVRVTGYDLKKGIYTSFPADVAEPGSVVLEARYLSDIVRSLDSGIVTISVDEGLNTTIDCEGFKSTMVDLKPSQSMVVFSPSSTLIVTIPLSRLRTMSLR